MLTAKINNNTFVAFGFVKGVSVVVTRQTRQQARVAFTNEASAVLRRSQLRIA